MFHEFSFRWKKWVYCTTFIKNINTVVVNKDFPNFPKFLYKYDSMLLRDVAIDMICH